MKRTIILGIVILMLGLANAQFYNTTNLTNANDIYEQSVALNQLTNGLVGAGFVVTLFTIAFVITSTNTGDILSGLSSGAFIATLSSVILMPLELVGFPVFNICLLGLIGSVGAKILMNRV